MTSKEYVIYFLAVFKNKAIMLFSLIQASLFSFVENKIGLSVGLIAVYFALAGIDTATGIYKNIFYKKQEFKSELFFKKLFSVCIMLIAFVCITMINEFLNLPKNNTTEILKSINVYGVYLFNLVKIFLIVSFIAYEFSSIRENVIALKWGNVVKIIDLILLPFTWISENIKNKIQENKEVIKEENVISNE